MRLKILEHCSRLIFPPACESCGSPTECADGGLCRTCWEAVAFFNPPFCRLCGRGGAGPAACCEPCRGSARHFDEAWALALYEEPWKALLHAFKFGRRRSLARPLAGALVDFLNRHASGRRFEAVAAVPLDRRKENQRGFNQSELLAKEVARALHVPHRSSDLARRGRATDQARLSAAGRRTNVQGTFGTRHGARFDGISVLLLDDVLTTGETASSCARALKDAGAGTVSVLVCARGSWRL